MTNTWKQLARNGTGLDGRLHLLRDGLPACGIAVKAGKGFIGEWATSSNPKARLCKKCRRLS